MNRRTLQDRFQLDDEECGPPPIRWIERMKPRPYVEPCNCIGTRHKSTCPNGENDES